MYSNNFIRASRRGFACISAISLMSIGANALAISVTASGSDGNVAANTLDNNLSTRWSADGMGQWIQYDLGTSHVVEALKIALYKGDQRSTNLDIQTSPNGSDWQTVFSGSQPSSTTAQQTFEVPDTVARYVRIVGYGNTANTWNSITEVDITTSALNASSSSISSTNCGACVPVIAASASTDDGNKASNVVDGKLDTRWSGNGSGAWLQLDLGAVQQVGSVSIAFYLGNQRTSSFDIQASTNGTNWNTVLTGAVSGGKSTSLEAFSVYQTQARYIRYVGYGNSANAWNSITEMNVSAAGGNSSSSVSSAPSSQATTSSSQNSACNISSASNSVTVGCLEYGSGGSIPIASLNPSRAPGENFNLSKWKITYPDASEQYPPQVRSGEFYTDPSTGAMVFQCPNNGGSTANSSYSRSELREMLNSGAGTTSLGNNWVISTASSSNQNSAGAVNGNMKATVAVDRVSNTYASGSAWRVGRVIVGQIHASENEPLKLYYRKLPGHAKGWVYMAYEDSNTEIFIPLFGDSATDQYGLTSTVEPVEEGIALGEKWGYEFNVVGRKMTVTVTKADGTWARQTINWAAEYNSDWFYFKAGAYNQNNGGNSGDYAQVSFYDFKVVHGNDVGISSSSKSSSAVYSSVKSSVKSSVIAGVSSSSKSSVSSSVIPSSKSSSSSSAPGGSAQYPSDLMDNYKQWKITYPNGMELKNLYQATNEYFYVNSQGNGIVFRAPIRSDNGTTPNSSYIRSELRERTADGSADIYWTTAGKHTVYVKQAITHLPIVKDHLVATQIHGNKSAGIDDAMVLRLEGSHLFLSFNGGELRSNVTVKTGYKLGTTHEVIFEVIDGKHYVYYSEDGKLASAYAAGNAANYLVKDGSNTYVMNKSYGEAYFKIGNYTQSNADREGSSTNQPDNYGEVVVYDFWVNHQ